jgi:serine/threonine-protein kinase RsbT
MRKNIEVNISSSIDIVTARQRGRELASEVGFFGSELTVIAAAISEVARNIVDYAQCGQVILEEVQEGDSKGIQIVARDHGPGISDLCQAMNYGYSNRKGLGVGLPGAQWLMDDFEITSKIGEGTTIRMKKWVRRHLFTSTPTEVSTSNQSQDTQLNPTKEPQYA